jgi:phosphoribosylglycinamide formyltransferase-1
VIASKPGTKALARAAAAGVECAVFEAAAYPDRAGRDRAMVGFLKERDVALVVLAGFMELLTKVFLDAFPNGIINVHPALLPAFPGASAIDDQLAYGVKVGGVTVHFVDEGVDTGPIILQEAVPLPASRDRDEVLALIHDREHELLPRAIRLLAEGAVSIDPRDPRVVEVDERMLMSHGD